MHILRTLYQTRWWQPNDGATTDAQLTVRIVQQQVKIWETEAHLSQ